MSKNNGKRIPAYDYCTGKDSVPYEGDFTSTIYEHKVVPTNGQLAPGDVRPDGKPYHSGVVHTKQTHWH